MRLWVVGEQLKQKTLYVEHNHGCNVVTVFDNEHNHLFSYDEWSDKDFWNQLKKLIDEPDTNPEYEDWSLDDLELMKRI